MTKFASLVANVADTFRVEIIDEITDEVLTDKNGNPAYIDVLSTDSEAGREFDRELRAKQRRSAMKSRNGIPDDSDPLDENQRKLAKLTKGWHLVDPVTRDVLDVPCTPSNALELYSEKGAHWLYVQAWVGASKASNFMKRTSSSSGPNASSEPVDA